jgi:hypothetical protein
MPLSRSGRNPAGNCPSQVQKKSEDHSWKNSPHPYSCRRPCAPRSTSARLPSAAAPPDPALSAAFGPTDLKFEIPDPFFAPQANRRRSSSFSCWAHPHSHLPEEHSSSTEDATELYRCPYCGGPMKVIERLTTAEDLCIRPSTEPACHAVSSRQACS